jgi:GNAT superfamily N-acetyltransferase
MTPEQSKLQKLTMLEIATRQSQVNGGQSTDERGRGEENSNPTDVRRGTEKILKNINDEQRNENDLLKSRRNGNSNNSEQGRYKEDRTSDKGQSTKEQIDSNITSFRTTGQRGQREEIEEIRPTFFDVVKTLYKQGKEKASKLYSQNFFDVATTPKFMKDLGISGDKFTIKYGVLSKYINKDKDHKLTENIWEQLPQAIQNPFAITKYYEKEDKIKLKGYRLYTTIKFDNGYVVVGVDVKNMGRDLEVNSISTIFNKNGFITNKEEEIYRDEKITPQQEALLTKPNSLSYQLDEELLNGKDKTNLKNDKEKQENSLKNNSNQGFKEDKDGHISFSIKAYHGSPYSFNKFLLDKIGSGEGAQSYGWGIYTTEVESIARQYAYELTEQNDLLYKNKKSTEYGLLNSDNEKEQIYNLAIFEILNNARNAVNPQDIANTFYNNNVKYLPKERLSYLNKVKDEINRLIDNGIIEEIRQENPTFAQKRNLYNLSIPDNTGENYIEYSEPINEATINKVEKALDRDKVEKLQRYINHVKSLTGNKFFGLNLYEALSKLLGSDKQASEFLSSIGFTGIKYPAQYTTGGREDGASNYVIFKEEDLHIDKHVQFSVVGEGEKDNNSLIGIHNITREKLEKAIKQKGLANPSTAVIDIDKDGFTDYGEVSLLMPKELIDSKTGKNAGTYTGDIYSPRYPRVTTFITKKGEQQIKELVNTGNQNIDNFITKSINDFYKYKQESPSLELLFLKDKKIDVNKIINKYSGNDNYSAYNDSKDEAQEYIDKNKLEKEYDKWGQEFLNKIDTEEKLFAGYDANGNKRYVPNTLENASKIMSKEALKGGDDAYLGLRQLKGFVSKKLTKTANIEKYKKLLVSKKDFEEQEKILDDEYWNIIELTQGNYDSEIGDSRLKEVVNETNPKRLIDKLNGEYKDLHLTEQDGKGIIDFIKKLDDIPTTYFETKFKRPVRLNEFVSAIVPDKLNDDIKNELKRQGLNVVEYKENDEQDRQEKTQEEGERQSILFSVKSNKPNSENSLLNENDFDEKGNITAKAKEEIKQERDNIYQEAKKSGQIKTIGGKEIAFAPNGKRSNLTVEQWITTRTKRFKEWFGDWEKIAELKSLDSNFSIIENNEETPDEAAKGYDIIYNGKKIGRVALIEAPNGNLTIRGIGIDENIRGKGIGKNLYKWLIYKAYKNGGTLYSDNVYDSTISPSAHRVWKSLIKEGFAVEDNYSGGYHSVLNASKVVDENGEPLVAYHGTDKDFHVFDKQKINNKINGFFFTTNRKISQYYGKEIAVFLNIKNPIQEIRGEKKSSIIEQAIKDNTIEQYDGIIAKADNSILNNKYLNEGFDKYNIIEIVAFNPNQIKSATENNGTYNKDNEDIRFSIKSNNPLKINQEKTINEALDVLLQKSGIKTNTVSQEELQKLKDKGAVVRLRITTGSEEKDNNIGKALYVINKEAKKYRDLKRELYDYYHGGEISEELASSLDVPTYNIEDGYLFVESHVGEKFYSVEQIKEEIQDCEDEIESSERRIEEADEDINIEEEKDNIDFQKEYIKECEELINTFEDWEDKLKYGMDKLKDREEELYKLKSIALNKLSKGNSKELSDGVHEFPKGDIRRLYKLGNYSFHGEDISDSVTDEEYEFCK